MFKLWATVRLVWNGVRLKANFLKTMILGVSKLVGLDQLENPLSLNLEVKGSILIPYKRRVLGPITRERRYWELLYFILWVSTLCKIVWFW